MRDAPVILISGLPGVGKSTTAWCLARRVDMGSPFAQAWDWIDDAIRNDTTRIGLWLDNTHLDAEWAVDAIVEYLGSDPVA